MHFDPFEYMAFRALERSCSSQLLSEWARWMQDLQNSSYEFVCRKAKAAPRLTNSDIDKYYENRIVTNHELDILETSSNQVIAAGRKLTSILQKRQDNSDNSNLQRMSSSSTEILVNLRKKNRARTWMLALEETSSIF
ncbi:hypothetical protein BC939DRAFT_439149 [Gamsiella multidivaricata]|uniref:uncharacterized protein n=1 Tax=Gamsiella multidivaricata TaxID=101098 RepID=UPI00221E7B4A|nr:uncharacterized protein BC939DRAFT_439149 [Gamsiella multidivaricata]KAI7830374.1 hypothetical protein BC939DRAFT_439149 [Gamsiella multidivaricata]